MGYETIDGLYEVQMNVNQKETVNTDSMRRPRGHIRMEYCNENVLRASIAHVGGMKQC